MIESDSMISGPEDKISISAVSNLTSHSQQHSVIEIGPLSSSTDRDDNACVDSSNRIAIDHFRSTVPAIVGPIEIRVQCSARGLILSCDHPHDRSGALSMNFINTGGIVS